MAPFEAGAIDEPSQTIEVRITNVLMTPNETVTVAGLIRALLRTCYEASENDKQGKTR